MQTGVNDGKKSGQVQVHICIPTRSVGTRKKDSGSIKGRTLKTRTENAMAGVQDLGAMIMDGGDGPFEWAVPFLRVNPIWPSDHHPGSLWA
jgi:hypothetical protein